MNCMPEIWKRAFCDYTFKWNGNEVTTVTDAMAAAGGTICVDIDYTVNSPFEWSTSETAWTGKHWYYMANNHRPSGELGRMVYRDSSPKLRVSTALVDNRLYLNNFEWCVIGDPYGFKMLNRYDPDQQFNEYIRVTDGNDGHNEGLQLEQQGTDSQNIFEMMPGLHSYNFWMHPAYTSEQRTTEFNSDACSYVGNNSDGSAAIISATKRTVSYLHNNSSANFRLAIRSDATLKEYLDYAGMVGALKYDVATATDIAAIKTKLENGTATDEEKTIIHNLINNPENTVNIAQGYYRIIPYTWEKNKNERRYLRGYLDNRELTGSSNFTQNLKVETQALAEYDPASIFWFESTTHDGTENGYPRYNVRTQGLNLTGNGLSSAAGFKCSYEGMGAAIMQLKSNSTSSKEYLSCAGGRR